MQVTRNWYHPNNEEAIEALMSAVEAALQSNIAYLEMRNENGLPLVEVTLPTELGITVADALLIGDIVAKVTQCPIHFCSLSPWTVEFFVFSTVAHGEEFRPAYFRYGVPLDVWRERITGPSKLVLNK